MTHSIYDNEAVRPFWEARALEEARAYNDKMTAQHEAEWQSRRAETLSALEALAKDRAERLARYRAEDEAHDKAQAAKREEMAREQAKVEEARARDQIEGQLKALGTEGPRLRELTNQALDEWRVKRAVEVASRPGDFQFAEIYAQLKARYATFVSPDW